MANIERPIKTQNGPETRSQITPNGVIFAPELPGPLLGSKTTIGSKEAAAVATSLSAATGESRSQLRIGLQGRRQA